jgi:outer membrane receptor protein involved in Fe transport
MQVGRLIRTIGVILLLPAIAFGADEDILEDEFAFLEEEDVVFSAAKHQQKAGFSPAAVIVITRKDIEESGAVTLAELLRRYPPIHVYLFDPLYPTAEIRGTYRLLMLLDGREVNLELFEAPFYSLLPVGLCEIERVEIVLGPNSALYGANAVTAVVNVTTRPPPADLSADVYLAAGEHESTALEALVGGGAGPLTFKLSAGIDRAASWMDRDLLSKDVKRASATLRLNLPDGYAALNGGAVVGAGRFYALMGYVGSDEFIMAHAKAEFELGGFKARAYWYGVRTVLDVDMGLVHPDMGLTLGTIPSLDIAGDTAQAEAQYDLELFENNLLIAGTDFRLTNYRCQQLVDPDIWEYRLGVFVHDEHRFGDSLVVTVGARFDYNSKTKPAVSPRAAVVYNFTGDHFLRLSGGTSFRKPSLLESSTNFRINANPAFPEIKTLFEQEGISNPDLSNEVVTSVELGYRGAMLGKALRLGVDGYVGFYRERISFYTEIRFDQTPLGPRINMDESQVGYNNKGWDTDIAGVTVSVEADPLEELALFFRGEARYQWYVGRPGWDDYVTRFLAAGGATLRLPFDLRVHLAGVFVLHRVDDAANPVSVLSPRVKGEVPDRFYLMFAANHTHRLGDSRLDLGLSLFNPFGGRFREEMGTEAPDGSNYGGEMLGTRVMLTARFRY